MMGMHISARLGWSDMSLGADRDALIAFLEPHVATSMFLMSNLIDYGFDRAHRNAMRMWITTEAEAVTGVVALTESGSLMAQLPPALIGAAARAIDGEAVSVILGPTEQMAPLRAAIGLADAMTRMSEDEPQLVLDMADLRVPDTPGELELGRFLRDPHGTRHAHRRHR